MANSTIQTSFNAGEWAPALNARVDLGKYHSGAALLRNFFVDYRGGASTRPGTKYVIQCLDSTEVVRLIPFQASFEVTYVLEFGEQYIRFIADGAPVLESPLNITGATKANPCVVSVVNTYNVGDVVFIDDVGGMTQLNDEYYLITAAAAGSITLANLNGVAIDSTAFGTYTSGGTVSRVYTITSPYDADDLALLKFSQNVNVLILTHPSYAPYNLTLNTATSWTLAPIVFGATVSAPGSFAVATNNAGTGIISYAVTAVDSNGQESVASIAASTFVVNSVTTLTGSWAAVAGAISYNVYRAPVTTDAAVPAGSSYGYLYSVTGLGFKDVVTNTIPNVACDFSETPPVARNPFQGAGVQFVTVTAGGSYTTMPTVSFTAAPAGGVTAVGYAITEVNTATLNGGGNNYVVNDLIYLSGGIVLQVTGAVGAIITTFSIVNRGSQTGALPANPLGQSSTSGVGTGATFNFNYRVVSVGLSNAGTGYVATPSVTFSAGAATATATLASASAGNPTVPAFHDQRLMLGGLTENPQQLNGSRPGAYYNFNISFPLLPDDACQGNLVSNQLNSIKSMISMPTGLIVLADRQAWLVTDVSATNLTSKSQSYGGASDVPPILANFDILFVQAKGSVVRDITYNFYTNIFTGTDISVLSSHLFYGYQILEWAFAEEPFKLVWAVRNDGTLLSLTFLKEQELVAWAHSDTEGEFKSVCAVTEQVDAGSVDATYFVVERVINGNTVKYIERLAERIFPNGAEDAWCVDAGIQYDGAPATTFRGAEHLAGETVTGLADGEVIPPFTMATTGSFTLATAASKVTVGLPFTPQLQTLALDVGEPTAQGKMKKIAEVVVRVQETLGLTIGSDFDSQVAMRDLVVGNVGGMTNEVVTGLVTGDAVTIIDPKWTTPGQYAIEQPDPLPASILGVVPKFAIGDK